MTINVLINVPHLNLPGGVANYYRVLRGYLDPSKQYFEVGTRADELGRTMTVRRLLANYWAFNRRLSTGNFSLVHLNPSFGARSIARDALFLLIARCHRVPVLVFFRGWNSEFVALVERRYSRIFRYVFGKAACTIVLANDFREQLLAMGIRGPILTATTVVDDVVFDRKVQRPIRDPLRSVIFLYLSRLDYRKGLVEALRCFKVINHTVPKARLTIAGDGPLRPTAEHIVSAEMLGNITFLGHVSGEAKRQAFLESDIFFFPTFFGEGMPNAVLEAMAYGLPVITRAVGGLRDFFENGRMGFITDSNDDGELIKLLERLALDPKLCHEIGEYNRRYAKDHFAASTVARRLNNVYLKVASGNDPSV